MSRNFRDEYTPWSFVLPMALAVMIGVLAADVVRLVVGAIMVKAAVKELNDSLSKQTPPGDLPARPGLIEPASGEDPIQYGPNAFAPELPGLLKANRDNLDRACIGGTVSLRENNGWSQDTSTGSPQRCTATSQ